jgi:hypothetical protein
MPEAGALSAGNQATEEGLEVRRSGRKPAGDVAKQQEGTFVSAPRSDAAIRGLAANFADPAGADRAIPELYGGPMLAAQHREKGARDAARSSLPVPEVQ